MSLATRLNSLASRVATEFKTVRSEVTSGLAGKANSSHTHAESDVTGLTTDLAAKQDTSAKGAASGYASLDGSTKVPIAQLPTGTTSTTVTIGNDSRLSDARTPTAHKSTHATGGTDALAPSDIGAQATSAKNAANGYAGLDSGGKVAIAQLGQSGSASSSTYLRGDGAWAAPTASVPLVPFAPFSVTYSSSITPDASQGTYGRCTLTGSPTLNAPSNGTDGQHLLLRFTAAATQTVTFSGMSRMSFLNSTLVVSAGKRGYVLMVYDGSTDGWTILAAGATA